MAVPNYRPSGIPNHNGYYCSVCKGRHHKKETLQKCFQDYYASQGRLQAIGINLGNEVRVDAPASWGILTPTESLPTGLYLTMMNTPQGGSRPIQLRIGRIPAGKWAGVYFVSYYDEVDRKYIAVNNAVDRETVIKKLVNGHWQRALLNYGRTFGICPICERPLENAQRSSGVHATDGCYSKVYG
jgi:hypothetical protein